MFDGFAHKRIETSGTEIALVQGGNGPPLLRAIIERVKNMTRASATCG